MTVADRSGLYPTTGTLFTECFRCGRATSTPDGTAYVFGVICNRADCRKVDEALADRFTCQSMAVSLPVEGGDGVPSCWSINGEVTA